jgi:hypothetical protein
MGYLEKDRTHRQGSVRPRPGWRLIYRSRQISRAFSRGNERVRLPCLRATACAVVCWSSHRLNNNRLHRNRHMHVGGPLEEAGMSGIIARPRIGSSISSLTSSDGASRIAGVGWTTAQGGQRPLVRLQPPEPAPAPAPADITSSSPPTY